jgi:hypothetical protein
VKDDRNTVSTAITRTGVIRKDNTEVIETKAEKPPDSTGNMVQFLVKWAAFVG